MSWQSHLVNGFLRFGKNQLEYSDVRTVRGVMRMYMNRLAELRLLPSFVHTHRERIAGVPCEWVWVPETQDAPGVIEYLHGGGFMAGSPASHRDLAWRLSRASGQRVLMVDYRLTPDFTYPAQLDDAFAVYTALLERFAVRRIALGGDSAGGNLVLTTILTALRAGLPAPAAAVCFSPWTDLTHSGGTIVSNERRDTMIPVPMMRQVAALYCAGADAGDPLLSPAFADLSGFPPLQLHAAEEEVLLDDTLRIAANAQVVGVPVECRIWRGVPHAFPVLAQLLPEARAALRQSGMFLNRRLAGDGDE